jgi:hypothetical protein
MSSEFIYECEDCQGIVAGYAEIDMNTHDILYIYDDELKCVECGSGNIKRIKKGE